jgi:hypothetical protein
MRPHNFGCEAVLFCAGFKEYEFVEWNEIDAYGVVHDYTGAVS